jgi:hypothetical protein
MTDVSNEVEGVQSPAVAEPIPQPVQKPASERMYTSSEVTEIVKHNRKEAENRLLRIQHEQPEYFQQKFGDIAAKNPSLSPDEVKRLVEQGISDKLKEVSKKAEEDYAQKRSGEIVSQFNSRVFDNADPDFENEARSMGLEKFPYVLQLSLMVDNTKEVMKDLVDNPIKLSQLESLAGSSPQGAIKAIKKLSESIEENKKAAKQRIPNEPLSQTKPSNIGMGTGEWSVKDAKAKYRG